MLALKKKRKTSSSTDLVAVADEEKNNVVRHAKKVVSEEDYVNALEKLIQRDFFPAMLTEADHETMPKMSMSSYLANYTSEDCVSFEEIMAQVRAKHREKYAWIDAEANAARKNAIAIEKVPELKAIESKDPRLEQIASTKYVVENSLMFPPSSSSNPSGILRRKRENRVNVNATRFQPVDEDVERFSELSSVTASTADLSHGTPRIRGYKLVRTPSPEPEALDKPIMTWGKVMATPTRIENSESDKRSGPRFFVPTLTAREHAARKLGEKASKTIAKRKRERMRSHMATPSPAARLMMSRARTDMSSELRASYSRTPKTSSRRTGHTPSAWTPSSRPSPLRTPTPSLLRTPHRASSSKKNKTGSLTDDLLDV